MKRTHRTRQGFTIVELLIVVVVIAILAAITIVAYNGITNQAKEATLKSDLTNGAKQLGITKTETGSYPVDGSSLKKSSDTSFQYLAGTHTFCLSATSTSLPGRAFHVTESGSIQAGSCPSSIATTMQTLTPAQCSTFTTFNGTNNEAIIELEDNRGGVTRTYQVAKLSDGKCWMLANLKLGSTTGTILLTPSDSNVATNFTLPQLTTSGTNEYDLPGVYGPIPGDTGSGATNYGYLYNWSAATAGETRTSHPETAGNALYSICPANWRLPSGGEWNANSNEFSNLNARMNGLTGVNDPGYTEDNYYMEQYGNNWRVDSLFKGALVGIWWSGDFASQSLYTNWWSSSAIPGHTNESARAAGVASDVDSFTPGNGFLFRSAGISVRCLLQ